MRKTSRKITAAMDAGPADDAGDRVYTHTVATGGEELPCAGGWAPYTPPGACVVPQATQCSGVYCVCASTGVGRGRPYYRTCDVPYGRDIAGSTQGV